jgi:ribokinase
VSKAENAATGLAVILLDSDGRNSIAVFPAANNEMTVAELPAVFAWKQFDALVLQLEIPDAVIIDAYRFAKRAAVPVFLDAGPARPFPLEELWGIDVLSPNETETLALTGIKVKSLDQAKLAAAQLAKRSDAGAVVIKLGSLGAMSRTRDGCCQYFPAFKVHAVDPTAAGDAFTAALAVRFLKTGDIRQSVNYANLAGALATTRLGAQVSLPTDREIEDYQQRSQLTL